MDLVGATLDRAELTELRDIIGADGVTELIDLFHEDAPLRLAAIEAAVAAADAGELRKAAHAYKGAAAGVGARRVAELARELEHDARAGSVARAVELTTGLREETTRALLELRAFAQES